MWSLHTCHNTRVKKLLRDSIGMFDQRYEGGTQLWVHQQSFFDSNICGHKETKYTSGSSYGPRTLLVLRVGSGPPSDIEMTYSGLCSAAGYIFKQNLDVVMYVTS